MKITYWSDYACPYCYIGVTNFKHALEKLGVDYEIEMKAFELNPYAKAGAGGDVVAMFAAKYQLNLEDARKRVESINLMAKEAGLVFDYSKVFYTNTFDAHRLTRMALDKGGKNLQNQVSEKLYKAYFADHVDVADREVLLGIAKEAGLDEAEVKSMLEGKDYSDEVSFDEQEARRNRVTSVPCFVVNEQAAIPGAMPEKQFIELVKKYFPEEVPIAI